ncbi:MAG: hypothetical protein QOI34_1084, partial [Verrucomicrobiota bacterium]
MALAFLCVGASVAQGSKKHGGDFPALVQASEIKGTHVRNLQNQDLGEIEEVLIEPDSGHVRFVILEVGGFLGIGATRVAVPWMAFHISKEGNKPKWILDATKERLEKAPKVQGNGYDRLYTQEDAKPVFVYWK